MARRETLFFLAFFPTFFLATVGQTGSSFFYYYSPNQPMVINSQTFGSNAQAHQQQQQQQLFNQYQSQDQNFRFRQHPQSHLNVFPTLTPFLPRRPSFRSILDKISFSNAPTTTQQSFTDSNDYFYRNTNNNNYNFNGAALNPRQPQPSAKLFNFINQPFQFFDSTFQAPNRFSTRVPSTAATPVRNQHFYTYYNGNERGSTLPVRPTYSTPLSYTVSQYFTTNTTRGPSSYSYTIGSDPTQGPTARVQVTMGRLPQPTFPQTLPSQSRLVPLRVTTEQMPNMGSEAEEAVGNFDASGASSSTSAPLAATQESSEKVRKSGSVPQMYSSTVASISITTINRIEVAAARDMNDFSNGTLKSTSSEPSPPIGLKVMAVKSAEVENRKMSFESHENGGKNESPHGEYEKNEENKQKTQVVSTRTTDRNPEVGTLSDSKNSNKSEIGSEIVRKTIDPVLQSNVTENTVHSKLPKRKKIRRIILRKKIQRKRPLHAKNLSVENTNDTRSSNVHNKQELLFYPNTNTPTRTSSSTAPSISTSSPSSPTTEFSNEISSTSTNNNLPSTTSTPTITSPTTDPVNFGSTSQSTTVEGQQQVGTTVASTTEVNFGTSTTTEALSTVTPLQETFTVRESTTTEEPLMLTSTIRTNFDRNKSLEKNSSEAELEYYDDYYYVDETEGTSTTSPDEEGPEGPTTENTLPTTTGNPDPLTTDKSGLGSSSTDATTTLYKDESQESSTEFTIRNVSIPVVDGSLTTTTKASNSSILPESLVTTEAPMDMTYDEQDATTVTNIDFEDGSHDDNGIPYEDYLDDENGTFKGDFYDFHDYYDYLEDALEEQRIKAAQREALESALNNLRRKYQNFTESSTKIPEENEKSITRKFIRRPIKVTAFPTPSSTSPSITNSEEEELGLVVSKTKVIRKIQKFRKKLRKVANTVANSTSTKPRRVTSSTPEIPPEMLTQKIEPAYEKKAQNAQQSQNNSELVVGNYDNSMNKTNLDTVIEDKPSTNVGELIIHELHPTTTKAPNVDFETEEELPMPTIIESVSVTISEDFDTEDLDEETTTATATFTSTTTEKQTTSVTSSTSSSNSSSETSSTSTEANIVTTTTSTPKASTEVAQEGRQFTTSSESESPSSSKIVPVATTEMGMLEDTSLPSELIKEDQTTTTTPLSTTEEEGEEAISSTTSLPPWGKKAKRVKVVLKRRKGETPERPGAVISRKVIRRKLRKRNRS